MSVLEVRNLHKRYGDLEVLTGLGRDRPDVLEPVDIEHRLGELTNRHRHAKAGARFLRHVDPRAVR